MNKFLPKQFFSCFLAMSFLLSFWICVENCQAENENNTDSSVLQNVQVENTEEDFCSVQTSPSAFFSNQKSFIAVGSSTLPKYSPEKISQQTASPLITQQIKKRSNKPPLQLLCQLRI